MAINKIFQKKNDLIIEDYNSITISDLKKYGKVISMKKPNIHDPNYVDAFVLLKPF